MGKKPTAIKKRGRPATGRDPAISGRVPAKVIEAMDEWAEQQGLTRSAAMAALIEAGLNVKQQQR